MKSHEKKAVEKAVQARMEEHYRLNESDPTEIEGSRIAVAAVRLAQVRAGRTYDDQTEDEALEYAQELVSRHRKFFSGCCQISGAC